MKVRTKQCDACPWRVDVVASRDIPGGYCEQKHAALRNTIAQEDGDLGVLFGLSAPLRVMACHETPEGKELACAGWLAHQLGPGNNIALRLRVRTDPELREAVSKLELVGEQHERFEDTIT